MGFRVQRSREPREKGDSRAYHAGVKRLTLVPHKTILGPLSKPIGERRKRQRRLSIGRRVVEVRRGIAPADDPLFADQRERIERRGRAPRRRLGDRRAGIRMMDLRNLDLSELDS